jgi:hypothetical protein
LIITLHDKVRYKEEELKILFVNLGGNHEIHCIFLLYFCIYFLKLY